MKYLKAENILEWIAIKANLFPIPIVHGLLFGMFSKILFTSIQLDIFETAKDSPVTIDEIAEKAGLRPDALSSVMNILTLLDYFKHKKGKYIITKMAKKWCLKDSPHSYYHAIKFDEVMCKWVDHLSEYLKTARGIDVHNTMSEEEWQKYQTSMEYLAKWTARSAPKITPMSKNPTEMLDIGGSHGLYCVELCKKYPGLNATILDLPQAVEKARPILEKNYSGDKIKYWAGNALTDDFGENKYNLILMSHLMHHLPAEDNIMVSKKAARALKPGGYFVVQDYLRPVSISRRNMTQIISDLVYHITSSTRIWTLDEVKDFQKKAGLVHCKVNRYLTMPLTQVCAQKV